MGQGALEAGVTFVSSRENLPVLAAAGVAAVAAGAAAVYVGRSSGDTSTSEAPQGDGPEEAEPPPQAVEAASPPRKKEGFLSEAPRTPPFTPPATPGAMEPATNGDEQPPPLEPEDDEAPKKKPSFKTAGTAVRAAVRARGPTKVVAAPFEKQPDGSFVQTFKVQDPAAGSKSPTTSTTRSPSRPPSASAFCSARPARPLPEGIPPAQRKLTFQQAGTAVQAAVRMQSPTRTKVVAAPFERQPDGQWRQSFTVAEVEEKSPGGSMACCAAPPARTATRKPAASAKEQAGTEKSQAMPTAQPPEQRQGAVGLEGWLLKRDGIRPNWHKRWFVLRADGLHFFEQQSQPPPAVIGSYDYQAQQAQTALGGIAVQEMQSVGVSTAPNAPETELEITCALTRPLLLLLLLPLLIACAQVRVHERASGSACVSENESQSA